MFHHFYCWLPFLRGVRADQLAEVKFIWTGTNELDTTAEDLHLARV